MHVRKQVLPEHPSLMDSGDGSAGFHIATLSSRHILEASAGDIEGLVYRHVCVLVAAVQLVALALLRSSGRIQWWFVIDDHVLTGQRQLDSNVERPATSSMAVWDVHDYPTPD